MSSEWHRLRLSQEDLPPLLCQYSWTRQGYELFVTDLTSIWSEPLSRKEILKRADESATTIDPSEDLDQLDLLLTKIGDAFRGDGGTTIKLNSGASADSLELNTSTKLPAPLRPLKWTLQLSREPASSTTSHLVLPLLRGEASWESRQRSLLDQLKQKDWVLGKLLDRFESLGADLGSVFPGAAGLRTARKGSSRAEAARVIKGIAPFNEESWLAESEVSSPSSKIVSNLIHELAGSRGSLGLERLRPSQDKWWSGLQRRSETTSFQEEEPTKASTSQTRIKAIDTQGDLDLDEEMTSGSEVDEFEQQEVVPRQRAQEAKSIVSPAKAKAKEKSLSPQPQAVDTNEATATESEAEPEPKLSPPHRRKRTPTPTASPSPKPTVPATPPKEPLKKPKKGLGVIGGKKKIPEPETERAASPAAELTQPLKQPPIQPEEHIASTVPPSKVKKPTRLGMVGGKAKAKAAPPTETAPIHQETIVTSPDRKPREQSPAPKQRVIDRVSPKRESLEPSLPAKAPSAAPAPEETEGQRADRKREELKRQLEAKSKAPTKKKRRF